MRRITVLLALMVAALVASVGEGTAQVTVEAPAAAWGLNDAGQLGNGSNTNSNVPVQVSNLSDVADISAGGPTTGGGHSLAVKDDATVWAWGDNSSGQLGIGSNNLSRMPVQVSSLSGVTAVAAGNSHSLALKNDGTVAAWGSNGSGRLGNGDPTNANSLVPVQVSNLSGVTAIAGGNSHSLALKNDGTVWAWGSNQVGQLGNGTSGSGTNSNVPVQVKDPKDPNDPNDDVVLTNVKAIAAGGAHSLALKNDGTVAAWGGNQGGQLGNGSDIFSSNVPVQVSNLKGVTAVASGNAHSLAVKKVTVKRNGKRKTITTVAAWGSNSAGQLGNGSDISFSNVPVQVSNLKGVTAVTGGGLHSLALKKDGTVAAWGANGVGQLGNGTSGSGTDSNVPVKVSGLSGATAVDGGFYHNLAR